MYRSSYNRPNWQIGKFIGSPLRVAARCRVLRFLHHGGSYVTRTSVNPTTAESLGKDFSIVIEKNPDTSCVRGPSDSRPTAPKNVTFVLEGALTEGGKAMVGVWRTNLGADIVFEQQDTCSLVPTCTTQPNGTVGITILVINNDVITITSLSTGKWMHNRISPLNLDFQGRL